MSNNDLTFAELRLATMLNAHKYEPAAARFDKNLASLAAAMHRAAELPDRKAAARIIAPALADIVIKADAFAAEYGIDLVQAIRDKLDPAKR